MIRSPAPLLCLLCGCGANLPPAMVQAIGLQACRPTDLGAFAGQPFATLAATDLIGPLRVIYPGQMLTHDIDPRRLNAMIDGHGRIQVMFCG